MSGVFGGCLRDVWGVPSSVYLSLYMDMVRISLCHIPTLYHYDRYPPGGNMTGGNMLGNHDEEQYDGNHDDEEE